MGQSAGAHSALCLLAMPDVRRLFRAGDPAKRPGPHRAFPEGAGGRMDPAVPQRARAHRPAARPPRAAVAVRRAGRCYRRWPASWPETTHASARSRPPFFPVADELADPAAFLGAAARGAAAGNVQVIIGTNRDEARAIVAANRTPDGPDARRSTRTCRRRSMLPRLAGAAVVCGLGSRGSGKQSRSGLWNGQTRVAPWKAGPACYRSLQRRIAEAQSVQISDG